MPFDGTGYLARPEADVVTEPWRKVLLDAADYIEAHGLAKNTLCNERGQRCALGAIYESTVYDDGVETPAKIGAHRRLTDYLGQPISSWNNAKGRTAAEVCDALRSCARS